MASGARLKSSSTAEKVAKLQAEVEALRQQLARSQRLATLGTMTAMVAHEFNNILTPIMNYAQLAKTNPALTGKAIDRAAEGGKLASQICTAILGMAGGEQAEPSQMSVAELIRSTLDVMGRDPSKDGIELDIDVPADLKITTRRVEIQQILLNLLMNARHALAGRPGPRLLKVSAVRQNGHVRLSVADNGPGVPPELTERIFDPFVTTKAGEGGDGGHGLGLAICRDLAGRLGGQITLADNSTRGARFELKVPATSPGQGAK